MKIVQILIKSSSCKGEVLDLKNIENLDYYIHWTLHEKEPFIILKGNDSYKIVQKHIFLKSSQKCANGLLMGNQHLKMRKYRR
jgi:hypothetical protein